MVTEIRPQAGPQERFLASPADIVIYGGAAGGGKSFGLLLDPTRYVHVPKFGAVIFRRTKVQIRNEGGLWDESETIYPSLGARGFRQQLQWRFPSGATISMSHLEHDKDRFNWGGAQIPYLGFDEMTHFSDTQFWYMLSRNRSTSGVPSLIRGTCNPDPDSFVAKLIAWWIDQQSGYPITARAGVIKYFARVHEDLVWGFSKSEIREKHGPECDPISLTFIPASVFDNKILLATNPKYLANLRNLPPVEREQLLNGNWLVRPVAGSYFKRYSFGIVDVVPRPIKARVRYWDRAATEKREGNDPDATVGLKMCIGADDIFYIEDVVRIFADPHDVEKAMKNCAQQDGIACHVGYMQDPGSAGVKEAQDTARALAGFTVDYATATGDKQVRCKPASSQAKAGNIKLVRAPWNDQLLRELENFPVGRFDDQVDALSGAFERLTGGPELMVS